MSAVYPWPLVQEAHPEVKTDDGMTILPIQFIYEVAQAMKEGGLKVYGKNVELLPPPQDTPALDICLNPVEVNIWLQKQHYPYLWKPAKNKKLSLAQRLFDLRQEAISVAENLRSLGNREESINKVRVSKEIVKRTKFKGLEASTIEHAIKASWWNQP
jgi:hypothetical protein